MRKKINLQLILIAALAIMATLLLLAAGGYRLLTGQVIDGLRTQAQVIRQLAADGRLTEELAAAGLNIERDEIRVTVISAAGAVLYDSEGSAERMADHSGRPEVEAALLRGEGWDIRKSATLDKNTFYYAIKTEEGLLLRVAREADSIFKIFTDVLPAILFFAVAVFAICVMLAHILTASLMKPVREAATRLEKQEEVTTYEELQPLVDTIRKQNESLLASVKIRQDFTANVSHELKTPLTSIIGYTELIESGMVEKAEDIAHFVAEIHKSSNRLLTLINDIIRLSELDVEEKEEVFERINLYEIVATCVSMLQINAERLHVKISMQGEDAYVDSTRQMMEELVYNLCDNAIRYNKEDGRVEVSVWNRAGKVALTVKDNGIGIPKEHQDRIFERFYRVDKGRSKSTGGTGLGLAIVKHILTKHEAKLELDSEAGQGTQIRIIL